MILEAFYGASEFPFVLSGGTALSRYYLHHRESEDLDFFCKNFVLDFEYIYRIINLNLRTRGFICEEIERADREGQIKYIIFVVSYSGVAVKLDFLEDPFSGMWEPAGRKDFTDSPVIVDAIELIYYRKLYSITYGKYHLNERPKDLVDLYFLNSVKPIFEMIDYTTEHNIGLDWLSFYKRLGETSEISLDRVRLIKALDSRTLSAWLRDVSLQGITRQIGESL
ncbi:MAG: nucleotidyl transferase AbiEii/AbiGii toxin family protein [Nitrospirae bacterium]|nr:nucleotidyl transferase AbiEii/AbiGii toxin family protein [Nitrospirota bacterium]